MMIAPERLARLAKPSLICAAAVAANLLVMLLRNLWYFSLFVDTVFTVAVTFALGPIAGVAVAALTWAADSAIAIVLGVGVQRFHPFVLVAIVEVLIVHRLRPADRLSMRGPARDPEERDERVFRIFGVFMRLTVVYAACVVAVSVLGGAIDFLYHAVIGVERPHDTGLTVLVMASARGGLPAFAAGVLSRVQVVFLDRLFVVFGGFLVSMMIDRIAGVMVARQPSIRICCVFCCRTKHQP